MRVALVASGVSARIPPPGFDAMIAVNTAAELFPADHWVFLDREAYRITKAQGCPVLWTGRNVWHQMKRTRPEMLDREWRDALLEWNDQVPNRGLRWRCFSGTAALVVAWAIGAKEVVTYGVDHSGTRDFAGRDDGHHRSEKRWEDERKIWSALRVALMTRGISVEAG